MIKLDLPDVIIESTGADSQVITEGPISDLGSKVKGFINNKPEKGGLGIDTSKVDKKWKGHNDVVKGVGTTLDTAKLTASELNKKWSNDVKKNNEVDSRSIIARASNSVKQCPIYVTQTIRAAEAHLLAKMFEKVYATFFQAAISQDKFITPSNANNLKFLNQYHTDIKESAESLINPYYEPIDDFDQMMQESVYCEYQLDENIRVKFSVVPSSVCRELIIENARLMNEPLTGFPYLYYEADKQKDKQNEYGYDYVSTVANKSNEITRETIQLSTSDLEEIAKQRLSGDDIRLLNTSNKDIDQMVDHEMPMPPKPDTDDQDRIDYWKDECQTVGEKRNREKERRQAAKREATQNLYTALDAVKNEIQEGKFNNALDDAGNTYNIRYDDKTKTYYKVRVSKKDSGTNTVKHDHAPAVPVPEMLRQSEIKKINGMEPYMIKATFIVRDPDTKSNTEVSYLIGIKSVMHLIYAQDLADELYELVAGNSKSLKKIRYKTGEISYADYMFNIKDLKADAAKNINYNKRWIATLKQLANYNQTHGSLLKQPLEFIAGRVPIPNATLILSQADVTMLVNKTGIDLSIISNAKRLAKNLFLIAIAIVDPSEGSMRVFFPDKDTDWDVQSLASIDAEVARTDNSNLMKELQKAVNR